MSGAFLALHPKVKGACRVCGTQNALTNAITRNTRICNQCMKKKTLVLQDGSRVRFCYGHRQLESLDKFGLYGSRQGCASLFLYRTFGRKSGGGGEQCEGICGRKNVREKNDSQTNSPVLPLPSHPSPSPTLCLSFYSPDALAHSARCVRVGGSSFTWAHGCVFPHRRYFFTLFFGR